jgi:hypothetical protein
MEDVYYLVHSTDSDKTKRWKQINTGHIDDFEHQFPGAFFTLVTKKNIDKIHLYPDSPTTLIFSKKLLEQNNYHINVRDYNGFITEENTYFPWNIDEAVKKIDEDEGNMGIENEVVFHDPISMKYLCSSIENKTPTIPTNVYLPHIPIENDVEPDLTKEPFYCFPLEKNYTGRDPLHESSREFFKKMAKLCGVKSDLPTDKIIEETKKKIPELYKHRNEQNTNVLKQTPFTIKPFTIKNPVKSFTIKNPLKPVNIKPIKTNYEIKLNGGKLRKTRKARKNRHSMRKR